MTVVHRDSFGGDNGAISSDQEFWCGSAKEGDVGIPVDRATGIQAALHHWVAADVDAVSVVLGVAVKEGNALRA